MPTTDKAFVRPRFAIFASGRGSNAMVLIDAFAAKKIPGEVVLLISNIPEAPVLELAKRAGIPTLCIPHQGKKRDQHEGEVLAALSQARVDHVLLAGYMRILGQHFLSTFKGRVLNIHPSLLPEFPGLHAAERAWQAARSVAGATVHFVDSGMDTGQVLLQGSLDVRGDEGEKGLAQRILTEVEHVIYPRAVRLFIERLHSPSPTP